MPNPVTNSNFSSTKIIERFVIKQRLFVNDKTQVYDVLDINNPDAKLVIKLKLRNYNRATQECQTLIDIQKSLAKSPAEKSMFTRVYAHGFLLAFNVGGLLKVKEEDYYTPIQPGCEYEKGEMWHYMIITKFGDTLDNLISKKDFSLN